MGTRGNFLKLQPCIIQYDMNNQGTLQLSQRPSIIQVQLCRGVQQDIISTNAPQAEILTSVVRKLVPRCPQLTILKFHLWRDGLFVLAWSADPRLCLARVSGPPTDKPQHLIDRTDDLCHLTFTHYMKLHDITAWHTVTGYFDREGAVGIKDCGFTVGVVSAENIAHAS